MKNILVTGASSGIGAAVSQYLDSEGYRVIMAARSQDKMEDMAASMKNAPFIIPADLSQEDSIRNMFDTCKASGIRLNGLVHCAGIGKSMPVKGIRINEDIHEQMKVNAYSFALMGKFFSSKRYCDYGCSLIAISSMASESCITGHCGYAASKAAVNAMVKVMAKEFARRKFRVNAILPTYVDTPLLKGDMETAFGLDKRIEQIQPLGIIQPEAVAWLAEFLISDKGKYITGALIPVTGGAM